MKRMRVFGLPWSTLLLLSFLIVVVFEFSHAQHQELPSPFGSGNVTLAWKVDLLSEKCGSSGNSSSNNNSTINSVYGDPFSYCVPYDACYVAILGTCATPANSPTYLFNLRASDGEIVFKTLLTFTIPLYSGWITWRPPRPQGLGEFGSLGTFYVGTMDGLIAVDAKTGSIQWRFHCVPKPPAAPQPAPAHPTYMDPEDVVWFTLENGVNSSHVWVVNATTGREVLRTSDIGYTLIWHSRAYSLAIYGSADKTNTRRAHSLDRHERREVDEEGEEEISNIRIAARDTITGQLKWELGNLTYSPPGLWDNPNADVDSEGNFVYVYTKPKIGFRNVFCLDGRTGAVLWQLPNHDNHTYSLIDYDTYAYDNDFLRLITLNTTTMVVQRFRHGEPSSSSSSSSSFSSRKIRNAVPPSYPTAPMTWSTAVPTPDVNSILLVRNGFAFSFGLSTNAIFALDASDGKPLWTWNTGYGQPYTGTVIDGFLLFGSSDGNIYSLKM